MAWDIYLGVTWGQKGEQKSVRAAFLSILGCPRMRLGSLQNVRGALLGILSCPRLLLGGLWGRDVWPPEGGLGSPKGASSRNLGDLEVGWDSENKYKSMSPKSVSRLRLGAF